ncbi:MAG TPA: hypothetical protein VN256_16840 [Pyrinomonadaceae bacterium]|nr:hypothetical protein [Pyrinomonadaceae bacterium]
MRNAELEEDFPKLKTGGYRVTSDEDVGYNCIAWALYDTRQYWQYMRGRTKGYYWPIKWNNTLASWMEVFRLHGFNPCEDGELESDTEKIAIYVRPNGMPSHVARQQESGKWTSKLGKGHDIEHDTLALLEGDDADEYGEVEVFMKRQRKIGSAWSNEQTATETT